MASGTAVVIEDWVILEDSNLFPDLIIEALLNVEAVVVRENRKAGQYVDTVAQWAEDAGLKVYYGCVNFHAGHKKSKWLHSYILQKLLIDHN